MGLLSSWRHSIARNEAKQPRNKALTASQMKLSNRYHIFSTEFLGRPVWVEAVFSLETARHRVTELVQGTSGEYAIFSEDTQQFIQSNLH